MESHAPWVIELAVKDGALGSFTRSCTRWSPAQSSRTAYAYE